MSGKCHTGQHTASRLGKEGGLSGSGAVSGAGVSLEDCWTIQYSVNSA